MDAAYYPFIAITLTMTGYFLGGRVRGITHMAIPFKEPISMLLALLSATPYIVQYYYPMYCIFDAYGIGYYSSLAGFWTGYIVGYARNQVDMIYVAVHKIVEMDQDIHYLVRYVNKQGQTCWQPQSFWGCCKTVFFGIHNPLQLTGNIYRTRHVSIRKIVMRIEADAVDVAGLEFNEGVVKKGPFKFKIVSRKYVPSPNVTDVPYNFIVNATGFNELFTSYANLEREAMESKSELLMSTVKGGAQLLNAMSVNNISQPMLERIKVDLEQLIDEDNKKQAKKVMKKEAEQ